MSLALRRCAPWPRPGRRTRTARFRSACTAPAGSETSSGDSAVPDDVAVDAQPVHLAAGGDLLLADDRNVVLGLAGDDAGVAADAASSGRSPCPSDVPAARSRCRSETSADVRCRPSFPAARARFLRRRTSDVGETPRAWRAVPARGFPSSDAAACRPPARCGRSPPVSTRRRTRDVRRSAAHRRRSRPWCRPCRRRGPRGARPWPR